MEDSVVIKQISDEEYAEKTNKKLSFGNEDQLFAKRKNSEENEYQDNWWKND